MEELLNEIVDFIYLFQSPIAFLIGVALTFYVMKAVYHDPRPAGKNEAWQVIVGDLTAFVVFAALLKEREREAGAQNISDLAKTIREILHGAPAKFFSDNTFSKQVLKYPKLYHKLQHFQLKLKIPSATADLLRDSLKQIADDPQSDVNRCRTLLNSLLKQYQEIGRVASGVIKDIDQTVFKGRLGDPTVHMPDYVFPILEHIKSQEENSTPSSGRNL